MLYKKYHRNFVKQFKKGTKFVYRINYTSSLFNDIVDVVVTSPYYLKSSQRILMRGSLECIRLINCCSGRIVVRLNVIQEISQKLCKGV